MALVDTVAICVTTWRMELKGLFDDAIRHGLLNKRDIDELWICLMPDRKTGSAVS